MLAFISIKSKQGFSRIAPPLQVDNLQSNYSKKEELSNLWLQCLNGAYLSGCDDELPALGPV